MSNTFFVLLRGIPNNPTVNIRSGAGTNFAVVVQAPRGQKDLPVSEAQPDAQGNGMNGKVFQWLKITMPDGKAGWVRDDLAEVYGDGTKLGYGNVNPATPVLAFSITRSAAPAAPAPQPAAATIQPAPALHMSSAYTLTATGQPNVPTVNVRADAGSTFALVFTIPAGTSGLVIQEIKADAANNAANGKIYNWCRIKLSDGRSGWVRDDLLTIEGDCSEHGYGKVSPAAVLFSLTRAGSAKIAAAPALQPAAPVAQPVVQAAPAITPAAADGQPYTVVITGQPNNPVVNVRAGAGVHMAAAFTTPVGTTKLKITQVNRDLQGMTGSNGKVFQWFNLTFADGRSGWVRDDLLQVQGDLSGFNYPDKPAQLTLGFNLTRNDPTPAPAAKPATASPATAPAAAGGAVFPAPLKKYRFERGFGGRNGHWGWDYSGVVGEPIYASAPCVVIESFHCVHATTDRPNFAAHGMQLSDSRGLSDPSWGYGYGHYVIVRYMHNDLPAATKQALANLNFAGAHMYVCYAHVDQRLVNAGQSITAGAQVATLGNTGNSSGPHLHLETRISRTTDIQWYQILDNLVDPGVMFSK